MRLSPLVTVIIPCYNHAKYISHCIESVLAQTYKNIELIVVDNGSIDDSYEKIKKYINVDGFKLIRLLENIPPGEIGGAVSIALKEASGEYISILYSDDWYMPDKIEKQVLCMLRASPSVGVVYCHGFRYFESTGEMKKWITRSERGYVFIDYLKNGPLVIPISPLVKKYCYEIVGVNHGWTGSEYDFLAMSQFVDFDYVDECMVVMRDHESNDAKNIESVYTRVCRFDEELFSNSSTLLRAGRYAAIYLAGTYLMFARDFAEMGDAKSARSAFFKALSSRPQCLLSVRGAIMVLYVVLPVSVFFGLMRLFRSFRVSLRSTPAKGIGGLD